MVDLSRYTSSNNHWEKMCPLAVEQNVKTQLFKISFTVWYRLCCAAGMDPTLQLLRYLLMQNERFAWQLRCYYIHKQISPRKLTLDRFRSSLHICVHFISLTNLHVGWDSPPSPHPRGYFQKLAKVAKNWRPKKEKRGRGWTFPFPICVQEEMQGTIFL